MTVIWKEKDKNKEYFINKINKYKEEHELITKKKNQNRSILVTGI